MTDMKEVFSIPGVEHSDRKQEQLMGYMEEILRRNESVNLTAITDRREFIQKHYADSLLCAELDEFRPAGTVIDVGTGGGFPGVPLAIAFPEKQFTLIDSLNKRIKIVNELCEKLGIANVTAIHGRAEELARKKELRETFDLCVSRAVANMSTLAEYCLPFVKTGGSFIAYKGPDCDDEVRQAQRAIELLGGRLTGDVRPGGEDMPFDHRLIIIQKEKNTPSKFPRKAGRPTKEPLR